MFPLYQTLEKKTEQVEHKASLTYDEKMKLCEVIKEMDLQSHEILYALIRNYQLKEEKDLLEKLPYQVKINKSKDTFKFDIDKLPPRLIWMVSEFVNLYLKKIEDEEKNGSFFKVPGN